MAMPIAQALDDDHVRQAERREDGDHDQSRAGDDAAGSREPIGHGPARVAGPPVRLLDTRQQQHLVVHRQAEDHAEHQDRDDRDREAGRREAEHARQVAVLEDPDERPEAGGQRQQGHDHCLDRQHHRSELEQKHDRHRHQDVEDCDGQLRFLGVEEIERGRVRAADATRSGRRQARGCGSCGRAPARPSEPASGLMTWRWTVEPRMSARQNGVERGRASKRWTARGRSRRPTLRAGARSGRQARTGRRLCVTPEMVRNRAE